MYCESLTYWNILVLIMSLNNFVLLSWSRCTLYIHLLVQVRFRCSAPWPSALYVFISWYHWTLYIYFLVQVHSLYSYLGPSVFIPWAQCIQCIYQLVPVYSLYLSIGPSALNVCISWSQCTLCFYLLVSCTLYFHSLVLLVYYMYSAFGISVLYVFIFYCCALIKITY